MNHEYIQSYLSYLRDLSEAFQYLKGAYKQERDRPFVWSDSDRTRENGFKTEREEI